jgi:hypothetical protein
MRTAREHLLNVEGDANIVAQVLRHRTARQEVRAL